MQAGFNGMSQERPLPYAAFLQTMWKYGTGQDYYRIPLYRCSRNYPLTEEDGHLLIALPAKVLKDPFAGSQFLFRVNYLAGDEKTQLKKYEEIITFQ